MPQNTDTRPRGCERRARPPQNSTRVYRVQVFCLEFDYLKLLVPYIPRSRPIAMLDAGANAGFASFLFARLMRFQGELVSVEMNPLSARMVRRNTMVLNAVPGMRSRVVNAALVSAAEEAATPEVRFMGAADGQFLANRLTTVKEYAGSEYAMRVPATSLPSLLVRLSLRHAARHDVEDLGLPP